MRATTSRNQEQEQEQEQQQDPLRGLERPMADADFYSMLMGDEPSAQEKAQALVAALRKQRAGADTQRAIGNLGMLTGDKVLGAFGRAQMDGAGQTEQAAQNQEQMLAGVGQHRLSASLAKLTADRQASQFGQQMGLEREKLGLSREKMAADKANEQKTQGIKIETDLRNKYMENGDVKSLVQMNQFRKQIKGAPKNGTGDLSRIYGLAKMYDPAGRVTDSDAEQAAKTGGLPGHLQGMWNMIMANGSLNDSARSQMDAEADRLTREKAAAVGPVRKSFRGLAGQYGVSPDNVVVPLGFEDVLGGEGGAGGGVPVVPAPQSIADEPQQPTRIKGSDGKVYQLNPQTGKYAAVTNG